MTDLRYSIVMRRIESRRRVVAAMQFVAGVLAGLGVGLLLR